MLTALHPETNVRIREFEEIDPALNGTFDVVSSNIPFGDVAVFDPAFIQEADPARKQARLSLHNYFFVKGVDMLRQGGVLAFITSQGVMNAPTNEPVREWLMNNCDLISAIRLPNNLFAEYAGTEVGSDLIVLQKNTTKTTLSPDEQRFVKAAVRPSGVVFNTYFRSMGQMVHTSWKQDTDPYGKPAIVLTHDGGAVRKGNQIAKLFGGNKVDVKIYAVERTLDAYKFNILQNKQLFIDQLKTGKLGSRTIDEGGMDEQSGTSLAECVAILSGKTDLLDKVKLEKRITALEGERRAFHKSVAHSKAVLEDKVRTVDANNEMVARIRGDWALFNARVQLDEQGAKCNPIRLHDVEGSDPKAIGAKLAEVADKARTRGEYFDIGSLYGFKIVVKTESSEGGLFELSQNRFFVQGESGISYSYNNGKIATDPLLASTNFLNALEKMPSLAEKYEADTAKIATDIPVLRSVVDGVWNKEDDLKALKAELLDLDRAIQLSLKPIDQTEELPEVAPNVPVEAKHAPDQVPLVHVPEQQSIPRGVRC